MLVLVEVVMHLELELELGLLVLLVRQAALNFIGTSQILKLIPVVQATGKLLQVYQALMFTSGVLVVAVTTVAVRLSAVEVAAVLPFTTTTP